MAKDKFLDSLMHDIKKMAPSFYEINQVIEASKEDCPARTAYKNLDNRFQGLMMRINNEMERKEAGLFGGNGVRL